MSIIYETTEQRFARLMAGLEERFPKKVKILKLRKRGLTYAEIGREVKMNAQTVRYHHLTMERRLRLLSHTAESASPFDIDAQGFAPRLRNALRRNGDRSMRTIATRSDRQLLDYVGVGVKAVATVRMRQMALGLRYHEADPVPEIEEELIVLGYTPPPRKPARVRPPPPWLSPPPTPGDPAARVERVAWALAEATAAPVSEQIGQGSAYEIPAMKRYLYLAVKALAAVNTDEALV